MDEVVLQIMVKQSESLMPTSLLSKTIPLRFHPPLLMKSSTLSMVLIGGRRASGADTVRRYLWLKLGGSSTCTGGPSISPRSSSSSEE